jgi:hypothetical protein
MPRTPRNQKQIRVMKGGIFPEHPSWDARGIYFPRSDIYYYYVGVIYRPPSTAHVTNIISANRLLYTALKHLLAYLEPGVYTPKTYPAHAPVSFDSLWHLQELAPPKRDAGR